MFWLRANRRKMSVNKKSESSPPHSTVSLREAVIKYLRENDLQNLVISELEDQSTIIEAQFHCAPECNIRQ